MRNKAEFIADFEEVATEEVVAAVNPVQDAAHTMVHLGVSIYTLPAIFTKTKKPEKFIFEIKDREKTDDPDEQIADYFYVGRGE